MTALEQRRAWTYHHSEEVLGPFVICYALIPAGAHETWQPGVGTRMVKYPRRWGAAVYDGKTRAECRSFRVDVFPGHGATSKRAARAAVRHKMRKTMDRLPERIEALERHLAQLTEALR